MARVFGGKVYLMEKKPEVSIMLVTIFSQNLGYFVLSRTGALFCGADFAVSSS